MPWTLGGVTLPDPNGFARRYVEKSSYHEMINGRSAKDITNRKEQYELKFTRITQDIVAQILAIYSQFDTYTFSVSDGSLIIIDTVVHIDVPNRDYNTKGAEYREDFTLILTEVR